MVDEVFESHSDDFMVIDDGDPYDGKFFGRIDGASLLYVTVETSRIVDGCDLSAAFKDVDSDWKSAIEIEWWFPRRWHS